MSKKEAVAVFTSEDCDACSKAVDDAEEILGDDLEVVELDISENEDAKRFITKYGYDRIPVTHRGKIRDGEFKPTPDHFTGRNRLKLKRWHDAEKARKTSQH